MFSALKRLTGSKPDVEVNNSFSNGQNGQGGQGGIQVMSSNLQKKFSRGINLNMKIIVKGDRNSGKTSLYRRLQGLPFQEEYIATEEIQIASIQWNYKTTDDIVKVEVWDIVDKANKKKSVGNKLKIDNVGMGNNSSASASTTDLDGQPEEIQYGLDATFLDVFKSCNGVIFVFDITKSWTWDYVKREIDLVPEHIPILILANHRDMGHHRCVSADTVLYFIEEIQSSKSGEVRYAESSMRNGFGLRFIHKFFSIPYLYAKREALLKQIELNREETELMIKELDYYAESDDANYEIFMDSLSLKRRQVADAVAPPTKISLEEAVAIAKKREEELALEAASQPKNFITNSLTTLASNVNLKNQPPSPALSTTSSTSKSNQNQQSQIPSTMSNSKKAKPGSEALKSSNKIISSSKDDFDFIPDRDDDIVSSFLEENSSTATSVVVKNNDLVLSSDDDNDDEKNINPLVASIVEDFVPESYSNTKLTLQSQKQQGLHNKSISSDEEEVQVQEESDSPQVKPTIYVEPLDFSIFEQPTSEIEAKSDIKTKSSKKKSKNKDRDRGDGERDRDRSSKKEKKKGHHGGGKKSNSTSRSNTLEDFLNGTSSANASGDGAVLETYEEL